MSTKNLRILVLTCSTRPGALGPSVTEWLTNAITPHAAELGVELVPVALGDLNLPLLDEEEHPSSGIYQHEHTRRWSRIANAADGFIVVTPEYNYGMPATLKNALDYLSSEWAWKPVGFVSYGNTSAGTRSVQHAKQVVTTLRMVPLGATIAIRIGESVENRRLQPDPARDAAGVSLLEELVRVSHALRPMRERTSADSVSTPVPGAYARRLTPDDAAEVAVFQRSCWVDEAFANDTLDIPALRESVDDVREWLRIWNAIGVWLDGRLLGMVRTRPAETDLHLGRLAVVPDLRGRGLGRWLLRTAEAHAEHDLRRILLFTGANSLHNIELYQTEGYQPATYATPDGAVCLAKDIPVGDAKAVTNSG